MERVRDPAVLEWLHGCKPEEVATGFDATGWEANIWILHAMYETDALPSGISHDDVHKIERAAGAISPVMIGELDLEEILADSALVGSPLGRSGWPGQGWKRLRWYELARRLNIDPFASDDVPGFRAFPYSSWPANIAPPGEGSLDREQFISLIRHLADLTPEGREERCFAFFAMCAVGEFDEPVLYRARLSELVELYDVEDLPGSPSNMWPEDRSWFVYTDWDLWGTKVSGSRDLINRLTSDADVETVSLHG